MKNMKIVVLDSDSNSIKIFDYQNEFVEDVEDFLHEQERFGLMGRVSNCQWMITDKLEIKIM